MGQSIYPPISTGTTFSSEPPVNSSSVLADGQVVTSVTGTSVTINSNGGALYLYAANTAGPGAATAIFTISGVNYTTFSGLVTATASLSGSQTITINPGYVAVSGNINPTNYSIRSITFASGTNTSFPVADVCYGTISGAGMFVAIQSGTNAIYSTNGINWTPTTLPSNSNWQRVVYGSGTFVAVGNNGALQSTNFAYSTNGITWTRSVSSGTSVPFTDLVYNTVSGTFMTLTSGGVTFASSNGGVTWVSGTGLNALSNRGWNNLTAGNGTYVAFSGVAFANMTGSSYAYSTNGTTWTAGTLPGGAGGGYVKTMRFVNGQFLTLFQGTPECALYSTNGTTWTLFSGGSVIGGWNYPFQQFGNTNTIQYTNAYYFVLGSDNSNNTYIYYNNTSNNAPSIYNYIVTLAINSSYSQWSSINFPNWLSSYGQLFAAGAISGNMTLVAFSTNQPVSVASTNTTNYFDYCVLPSTQPFAFGIYSASTSEY